MGLHTRLFPECNLCFLLYLEPPFLYTVSVNQAASLPVANTRLGLRHRQRKDLGLFFSKAHRGTSWKCLFHLFPTIFRLSDTPMNFPSYFLICVFLDQSNIHCTPVAHVAGTVATFASLRIAHRTNPSSACGSWDLPNALKEEVYRLDI